MGPPKKGRGPGGNPSREELQPDQAKHRESTALQRSRKTEVEREALEILAEWLSARFGADEISTRMVWALSIALFHERSPLHFAKGGRA